MDTLLTGFPISSTVIGLLSLVKFTQDIADVPTKTRLFLHTLSRISIDLTELTRLRTLQPSNTEDSSGKYIDGVIADARDALHTVDAEIENCKRDLVGKKGDVGVWHRLEWYLWNEGRFLAKEKRVETCHRAVVGCLSMMWAERGRGKEVGQGEEMCCEDSKIGEEVEVLISPRMWREKSISAARGGDVRADAVPVLPELEVVEGWDERPPPYKADEESTPWLRDEDERGESKQCDMLLYMAAQRRGFCGS